MNNKPKKKSYWMMRNVGIGHVLGNWFGFLGALIEEKTSNRLKA